MPKKVKKPLSERAKCPKPKAEDPKKVWAREERAKKIREDSELALNSPYRDDRGTTDDPELKDAWQSLAAAARVQFPEKYAAKFMLEPKHRLAAIATCLEWPIGKIAEASGFSETSVRNWLKRPDVMEFMEAFNHFRGASDPKGLIDQEVYPSILAMKEIRDDSSQPAAVRKDIAKFFVEMKMGKAKETVEQKGFSLSDLYKEMKEMKKSVEIEKLDIDPLAKDEDTVH